MHYHCSPVLCPQWHPCYYVLRSFGRKAGWCQPHSALELGAEHTVTPRHIIAVAGELGLLAFEVLGVYGQLRRKAMSHGYILQRGQSGEICV